MGKERYTPEQVANALTATKGMMTLAAQELGCDYNTVNAYIKRYAMCRKAREDAFNNMGDRAELKLYTKGVIEGDTASLIFLLKTRFKQRGYTERIEHLMFDPESMKRFEQLAKQLGKPLPELFEDMINVLGAELSDSLETGGAAANAEND